MSCCKGDGYDFTCIDCGCCTGCIGEYYMLQRRLWLRTMGLDANAGMMCLGCVEVRIRRKLRPADFLPCPLNFEVLGRHASERMLDRMGVSFDG